MQVNQEFLNCYLDSDKKPTYTEVSRTLNFSVSKVKDFYLQNSDLLDNIQTLRLLHNSIKNRSGDSYKFDGFKDFYSWYNKTPKICCYCGVSEETLENVWNNHWRTKRGRGRKLEVERVDSTLNLYNSTNCKLACYFCNNHKSDLITQEHYDKYFSKQMKAYLEEISKIEK